MNVRACARRKPYGSYWLYRNDGESVVQLFDLSQLPSHSGSEGKRKWDYILAMLCYRCAGFPCPYLALPLLFVVLLCRPSSSPPSCVLPVPPVELRLLLALFTIQCSSCYHLVIFLPECFPALLPSFAVSLAVFFQVREPVGPIERWKTDGRTETAGRPTPTAVSSHFK